MLRAAGLGVRTARGPVFEGLTLDVPAGKVVALCGPAGSGRSMALLALSGRAATTAGSLVVAGATARGAIRRLVVVARIGGAVELEPDLTVGDLVRERRLFGARGGVGTTITVGLAAMEEPAVVVVDDVDLGLDDADRAAAWAHLTGSGLTVVATAAQPPAGVAATMMGTVPCAS